MEKLNDETQEAKKNKAKAYLKGWIPYRIKRYWAYAAITVVAIAMPWITIGGNHLFLLSFDREKIAFGRRGF